MRTHYAVVLLALSAGAGPSPAQTRFRAELDGTSTVPPTPTTATGSCEGTLNDEQTEFIFSCTHDVSSAAQGHIHQGGNNDPATVGSVVFAIAEANCCPASSTWFPSPDEVELLLGSRLYVNIHSSVFAAEAIRGQLVPVEGGVDGGGSDSAPQFNGLCGSMGGAALILLGIGLGLARAARRRHLR